MNFNEHGLQVDLVHFVSMSKITAGLNAYCLTLGSKLGIVTLNFILPNYSKDQHFNRHLGQCWLYKKVLADSVVTLYIPVCSNAIYTCLQQYYIYLFAVVLYIPVCRYNYFYLFDETIRARYIEVVADAMIRLGDQTLQCLVNQEQDVLGPRTLNGHRQLTVTAEEKQKVSLHRNVQHIILIYCDYRYRN